jgi:hypothetical protein
MHAFPAVHIWRGYEGGKDSVLGEKMCYDTIVHIHRREEEEVEEEEEEAKGKRAFEWRCTTRKFIGGPAF